MLEKEKNDKRGDEREIKKKEEERKGKNEEENVHRKLKRPKSASRVSTDNRGRRRGKKKRIYNRCSVDRRNDNAGVPPQLKAGSRRG